MANNKKPQPSTVGIVMSGAVARGAYEAGALEVIYPWLVQQGLKPRVLVGTSAGAINAVLLTQYADHHTPQAATQAISATWTDQHSLFTGLLTTVPKTLARYSLALAGLSRRPQSLLDPEPLHERAHKVFDRKRFRDNLEAGHIDAVGIAATHCPQDGSSGRTRLFLETADDLPAPAASIDESLDYAATRLQVEHILASAAVPAFFPPVRVETPAAVRGWYIDGGVRLNTPIKPALDLGVDRLIVISSHATHYPPPHSANQGPAPGVEDAIAQVLHSVLADSMIEDLANLRRTNRMLRQLPANSNVLCRSDGRPYRTIEYMTVSPRNGQLADLAARVYRQFRHWDFSDNRLLGLLLGASQNGFGGAELLSYVLFERNYMEAQIELGRKHAQASIAAGWLQ